MPEPRVSSPSRTISRISQQKFAGFWTGRRTQRTAGSKSKGREIMSVCLPIKNTREHYELRPSKIIALGLNYRDHIRESQSVNVRGFDQNVPREPILFPKTPNVLIGPGEPILIPSFIQEYGFEDPRVDYEAELAIIIKDKCKNVPEKEAMEHILGFTCMNDVSQRDLQNADRSGWFR